MKTPLASILKYTLSYVGLEEESVILEIWIFIDNNIRKTYSFMIKSFFDLFSGIFLELG